MDDHQALVTSLGEHCVLAIGRENLRQLTVSLDTMNWVAQVEICLAEDTWAAREFAIDAMVEVRALFLDETSVAYAFTEKNACADGKTAQGEYAFA